MKTATFSHFLAYCLVFLFVANTQAAVSITTQLHPTPGLPGHTTAVLTATSSDPLQPILGFDFSGHPDDNSPVTGKGLFGPMNHVNPAGGSTVFSTDWDVLLGFFIEVPVWRAQDSHFLVNHMTVSPGLPHYQEGPNILQAAWAYTDPQGLSVPFAQLVIPNSTPATVLYRGQVLIGESGNGVLVDLTGTIAVPEPTVGLASLVVASFGWGVVCRVRRQ